MSEAGKTFKLRYVGARFEGTRLSVDVLLDLPAFKDLLIAYARVEWRKANSDRERVPKGFDKSISLDLVAIEDGSAVPVLNWDRRSAQTTLPGFRDEIEYIVDNSFSDIIDLIDNAGKDQFPRSLSSEHIRALNRFGSGLREGERIEFVGTSDADGKVIFLDSFRRKKLITRVRETYQVRIEGSGILLGAVVKDTVGGYIVLDTMEFGHIELSLEATRVIEDFDGNINADVQFDLQVELDNNDKFRSVVEIHEIGLVDAQVGANLLRCRERLSEIKNLKTGWYDGEGEPIDLVSIETAELFLSKKFYLSSTYKIYPMQDGRILFEFEINDWDYSLEFGPGRSIEMYGVEIDGDSEMEPIAFPNLNDDFLKEFNSRTGR
jgi:hypothetical protein